MVLDCKDQLRHNSTSGTDRTTSSWKRRNGTFTGRIRVWSSIALRCASANGGRGRERRLLWASSKTVWRTLRGNQRHGWFSHVGSNATQYSPEQATGQMSRTLPQAGGHRGATSGSNLQPSVLSANAQTAADYGYQGSTPAISKTCICKDSATDNMGHVQQGGASGSSMQGMQLRMSTPYDSREYAQPVTPGATATSRYEQAPALFHPQSQSMQAQQYSSYQQAQAQQMQGQGQTARDPQQASSMAQYRASQQAASPQYLRTTSNKQQQQQQQQHHYGQQDNMAVSNDA